MTDRDARREAAREALRGWREVSGHIHRTVIGDEAADAVLAFIEGEIADLRAESLRRDEQVNQRVAALETGVPLLDLVGRLKRAAVEAQEWDFAADLRGVERHLERGRVVSVQHREAASRPPEEPRPTEDDPTILVEHLLTGTVCDECGFVPNWASHRRANPDHKGMEWGYARSHPERRSEYICAATNYLLERRRADAVPRARVVALVEELVALSERLMAWAKQPAPDSWSADQVMGRRHAYLEVASQVGAIADAGVELVRAASPPEEAE